MRVVGERFLNSTPKTVLYPDRFDGAGESDVAESVVEAASTQEAAMLEPVQLEVVLSFQN